MKELRIAEIRAEAPAEGGNLVLYGRPIVFDAKTTIHDPAGDYIEVIKRGALDGADISDVRLFYNHNLDKVPLARTKSGTMELKADPAGLEMKATLPDTQEAKAVYEAVKRGDLDGMSFAFTVPDGGDSYDPKTKTRTINKIAKLYECSVVPFPAYPQTSVEARNVQKTSLQRYGKIQQAKILINQIRKSEV